jgi:hypothetical protein
MFGSTARDEAEDDSDVDLFFDHEKGKLGLFELMDVKERAASILGGKTDDAQQSASPVKEADRRCRRANFLMTELIVAPRLADIIEAIERIRRALDGVTLKLSNRIGKSAGWLSAELKSFPKRAVISRPSVPADVPFRLISTLDRWRDAMIVCWTVSPPIGSCGGRGRPRRHLRRRLRGEGAFNEIGISQVCPVLSREVTLRTGEAPLTT